MCVLCHRVEDLRVLAVSEASARWEEGRDAPAPPWERRTGRSGCSTAPAQSTMPSLRPVRSPTASSRSRRRRRRLLLRAQLRLRGCQAASAHAHVHLEPPRVGCAARARPRMACRDPRVEVGWLREREPASRRAQVARLPVRAQREYGVPCAGDRACGGWERVRGGKAGGLAHPSSRRACAASRSL